MTTFRTWINFKEEDHKGEKNTLPSKTQPDEVMSIKEMIIRHARGLPIHANEGVYLPEEIGYIPDIKTLDLTEIAEYRDQYQQSIERLTAPPPSGSEADTPPQGGVGTSTTTPPSTTTTVEPPSE